MIDFSYKLIDPCGKEREEYKKIHRELFPGAAIDDSWIDWYHKKIKTADARLTFTRTYGLYDRNSLIGIWSVEPKIMRNNKNELMSVGRCFAVGISSDYRRMGLFVSLSEYAIESEKKLAEFEYIIGFPQTGRSVVGGHLKAGWEEISFVDIYGIDLSFNDGKFYRSDSDEVTDFSILSTPLSTINSFDEPSIYRNLRFSKHPKLQYMMYTYGDAHIILKPYAGFCHILEMQGSPKNVIRLIEVSKSLCKRHGFLELNVWNNTNAFYHDALTECGFAINAEHGLPITIIAVRILADRKLAIDNKFNFGMGVEEGY